MKKFIVSLIALFSVLLMLTACGGKKADFDSAEKFESALNDDDSVKNKTLRFTVEGVDENTPLGHMIYAGKHLNFVSEKAPKMSVKKGDTITVKVTSAKPFLGSWVLAYTNLSK